MNRSKVKFPSLTTKRAHIAGRTYDIPEYWIMGYCRNGRTVLEAIQYWHYQQVAGEAWLLERDLI